jgi:hypothetical protein
MWPILIPLTAILSQVGVIFFLFLARNGLA